ncbi:CAP domain-containing protein [Ureibacillus composti]
MNKKFLATSLMAATLFGASFTATTADAASLNNKSDNAQQYVQIIKGDNYQAIANQLINQIDLANGKFDFNQFQQLVNKTLNGQAAVKVIKEGKEVYKDQASKQATQQKAPAKATNNTTAPAKATNNTNTTAPTNTNTQQAVAPTNPTTPNASQSVSNFEQQVVDLTNAERTKAGLKPLEIYAPLMKVAEAKSADMSKNNYFSHTSPTYGSPFDQIKAAGISYKSAGENIAQGQKTPAEVVQAWMDSPGHRQNIMNANYTHIGVGYVENGNYWTQQFIQQ